MSQHGPQLLNARVETLTSIRIAYQRHNGPESTIDKTFRRFIEYCGDKGLLTPTTKYIGVAHEVVAGGEPKYDVAITISRDFRPTGDVQVGTIEAGEYAIVTYQGPYWGIDAAYTWLEDSYLKDLGRQQRAAPSFEVYLNDIAEVPEHMLLTDVHLPLAWY